MARSSFRLPGIANDLNMQGRNLRNTNFNWNNQTAYGVGDVVIRNNQWYVSLQDNNDNRMPEDEQTFWRTLATVQVEIPEHIATDTYSIGDLVRSGNNLYWAEQAVPANTPITDETHWNQIAELEDIPEPYARADNTDGYLRNSDITISGNTISKTDGTGFQLVWNATSQTLTLPDLTDIRLALFTDIEAEQTARANADTGLQNQINDIDTRLSTEINDRTRGDSALQTDINRREVANVELNAGGRSITVTPITGNPFTFQGGGTGGGGSDITHDGNAGDIITNIEGGTFANGTLTLPTGGQSALPLLQQAIQHVKLSNAVSQVMETNGTPSQFTLQNGTDTITQEFNFDAAGNPSLFIFTSPAIEAFAEMNGAPVGQRDLERTFTFTPGNAIPTSEWTFGSGETLSFSFDRTRGVFREIRDLGNVSTITSRGEFNISSGYNIDSRGQVTEA